MAETIKASEQNLKNIYSDQYLFEIPLYQRPYAWTKQEAEELLDDLLDAMKRDPDSPYFLGSIVLIKNEEDSQSTVVDGQQRLTTLTMLFCVLRDLAEGTLRTELDGFIKELGNSLRGTRDRYRLTLRERDRVFFHDNVQKQGAIAVFLQQDPANLSDSQQRMFENVQQLNNQIAEIDESTRERLIQFVINHCYLVVVTATDRDSAYRIFSVMNDRGLDLSPTDILKAETIGKIPDSSQDSYGQKWEDLEERIGRDNFRELFAHIRMITLKSKLRRTLQADFQDFVLSNVGGEQFIDDTLEPYADVYDMLVNASYASTESADQVNVYLRHLGRLDNFDWIPPAMAFFKNNQDDRGKLITFTQDLERLAYGLFLRRANINERINRYAEILRSIEQNDDLFATESPLGLTAEEKQEIIQSLNGPIYLQAAVVRRTLLERLDSLLAGTGATYSRSTVTVEHVLPQNPDSNSQWLEWFPDEPERIAWTHRLANLVLLSHRKNAAASNYEFRRKKDEYFRRGSVPPFALTAQVLDRTEWTPSVLEARQLELLRAFKKEWRLE